MAKRNKNDDDQSQENLDNLNDADNFGLPDLEYKPLDSTSENQPEEVETPKEETQSYSYQAQNETFKPSNSTYNSNAYESEEGSKAPLVIGLIITLVVIVSGFLIYYYVYKPQADKAKQEQIAKENEKKRLDKIARDAKAKEEADRKAREEAEALANVKPATGSIETLTDRTRRYYVVISSAVDGDLLMDYAKKLNAKGTSLKIIPPFGKWKFYRLAIGDYDTFADAQANADKAKAEYGSEVWVIKF
jgi:hypothetical protein